jgi:tetratricopeptide (TPR) repeat protein
MRVPQVYLDLLRRDAADVGTAAWFSAGGILPGGQWVGPVPDTVVVYPPVGFLPWVFCSLGNGDDYGYYWPIGKEKDPPIVALMSHDCRALNPIASSADALARLGKCRELAALFGISSSLVGQTDEQELHSLDFAEQLLQDEGSPFLLVANADAALAQNEPELAQALYSSAVQILPEYTSAHYGLAVLYRRTRRMGEALRAMVAAIRCPACFRGASFWADEYLPLEHVNRQDFHRKCLYWLQRVRTDPSGLVADDPLFEVRDRLSFASGVTTNDDYLIYEDVINEYVRRGKPVEAIQLAMRYGELMMGETTPFRERYGFTLKRHRTRLRELLNAAGLADRSRILE